MLRALTIFLFLTLIHLLPAEVMLIPRGSVWKFYYNGAPPANWFQAAFDDSAWPSGPAQIGYGEHDEATVAIDDPGFEPTLYFRRSFSAPNPSTIFFLTLRLLADDGAVIYLNGLEISRWNMPAGPVSFSTPAASNIETNENRFVQLGIFVGNVRSNNVIAVEVHQHPANSSDCSFDLELLANVQAGAPSIAITSPTDGAVLSAQNVVIQTASSDPAGNVTRVDFYTNGVLLGHALAEPFSFIWSNSPPGRYAITATAIDSYSLQGYSQRVNVQIGAADLPVRLLRGPWLQSASSAGIVLRWRTDWLTNSIVRWGAVDGLLDHAATNVSSTAEHELLLTGLQPDTKYFYSIGSSADTFAQGEQFYFRTSPTNTRPTRLWVIGDSGTRNSTAAAVRDAYTAATGSNHADLWLMLGDNAYPNGTDEDYQQAFFEMYPEILRNTVVWPTLGNHDAGESTSGSASPYLDIFTLPRNGESGGLASGSELYYSFDYANIHFICLDSFLSDRSTNGPMFVWLGTDLAVTDKDWIIAFWHHPPYSWGTHNSDLEFFLIEMREHFLPLLESYGVDLVLSGHSHVYERSFLLNGHYGLSSTFHSSMALDPGPGSPEIAPYRKPAGGIGSHMGAVYTVCGCSGAGDYELFDRHPAMAVNLDGFGSMIIDIDGLTLTAKFLRPSGAIDDSFAIDKSAPTLEAPQLTISRALGGTLLSWPTSLPAFEPQFSPTLFSQDWDMLSGTVTNFGRRNFVPIATTNDHRFFRLHPLQ